MADYECYRKRQRQRQRGTCRAWAWIVAWAVLSSTIGYTLVHRF